MSLPSHPQGPLSAKNKLLIFARELIQWKMKIAVHMDFAERQHYRPAMLELKTLHNVLNAMKYTAI